jgi:sensor histidine kinase regulating citrate/malate metabolism
MQNIFRDVWHSLPVPVVCVADDQEIILANEEAKKALGNGKPMQEGKMIWEYLPDSVNGRITVAVKTHTSRDIRVCSLKGKQYHMKCIPVILENEKKGGVLMFNPVN